ncbi:MAG: T9SS type A sorting domain-containing protein [Candidatus Azobacteroides sp.]|nr:T9SS type A sorting domain-containing protein [Candidatus Azobacteroides sp.]
MKKLVTILVSSIVGMIMYGQTPKLPVTILGDVYVAPTGTIESDGPVHFRAVKGMGYAKVANYGTIAIKDSAIFYTNDSIDGLLMNQNTAANSVSATQVKVRKVFAKNNAWYMMSLPFDVELATGIVNPLTRNPLRYNGNNVNSANCDVYIQYYNSQKRANDGKNQSVDGDSIWQMLPSSVTKLEKGKAYRIAVLLSHLPPTTPIKLPDDTIGAYTGRFSVDFVAATTVTNNIPSLLNKGRKGVNLTYATSPAATTNPSGTIFLDPQYSEGWNAIGGLNSTNYVISGNNIDYAGAVYVRYNTDASGAWRSIYPLDTDVSGTLRPYGVLFVQTNDSTTLNLNFNGTNGGFTYIGNTEGLDLTDQITPLFRSSTSVNYDLVKLQLTSVKTSSTSPVYFKFNDNYSQLFKLSDGDAFQLTTSSTTDPIAWAVTPSVSNINDAAFVSCLPYNNNEVPIGVNIPAAGQYVFSLKNITTTKGIASATLRDKTANIDTNILKSDYTFQASSAANTVDRFVLFINKTMTAIDQVTTADIYAYAENNTITVKNLNSGDKVQILDLTGRIIASGVASSNTYSATVNQKGVYIVNVRGEKTNVLKVLNK